MSEENKYVSKAGKFLAKVKTPPNGWFGEAGTKATPFIRIPLVVAEGEEIGKEIVWRGYVTPNAFENTIKTLTKAFGWDGDIEALTAEKSDPFSGKEVQVVCEEEEYEGQTRIKVRWLNAVGGGAVKLDKEKLANLAKLAKKAKAIAAQVKAESDDEEVWAPAPSTAKNNLVHEDDDIPF